MADSKAKKTAAKPKASSSSSKPKTAKKLTETQRVDELAKAMSVVNRLCDEYEWPKPSKEAPPRVGLDGITNAERLLAATNLVGKDTA